MAIFRNRNFRLLWIGSTVSQFGDQFYIIALPWLVLLITGDSALALGSILAAAGIPRAIFMMLGGAIIDRISPKKVMLASALLRAVLVGLLALLVITGHIELWMVFVLAIIFGFADAFAIPAFMALLPRLVGPGHLAPANALLQGAVQVSGVLGPLTAGLLIAFFGNGDASGVGLAFALDAATFVVVAATLFALTLPAVDTDKIGQKAENLLTSIKQGLGFVFSHPGFRSIFILAVLANILVAGPMAVGLPLMAKTQFDGGSTTYGILMSAFAAGGLIGALLVGILPRPSRQHFGSVMLLAFASSSLALLGVAVSPEIQVAVPAAFLMSLFNTYGNIMLLTWLQQRAPPQMLGRVMSILMTASFGLVPISMAVAGALMVYDVRLVLGIGAGLCGILDLAFLLSPSFRNMDVADETSGS